MTYTCEICTSDFVARDEEEDGFFKGGCPPICHACYRKEIEKLFKRSSANLQEIRAGLGPR